MFNVLNGDKESVDALLPSPDVEAVSFVGSTPVARYVHEEATRRGKRAQALGGAKTHLVILPDADLDLAADAAVSAGYGSAGERCRAVSVLVAVGSAADELVARVAERTRTLVAGDGSARSAEPTQREADIGPLVTKAHRARRSRPVSVSGALRWTTRASWIVGADCDDPHRTPEVLPISSSSGPCRRHQRPWTGHLGAAPAGSPVSRLREARSRSAEK